ncbi:alpha/beta hydrolase, partial [Streptomyces tricolor]
MDSELEAFVPLFPKADLTDPVTARKNLAELAAGVPAPDTADLDIEDRTEPPDPHGPVGLNPPHQARG